MTYRNENKGIVGGVAAGIADSYNLSVWLVRGLFILGFLLAGMGLFVYMWYWNQLPQEDNQIHLGFS